MEQLCKTKHFKTLGHIKTAEQPTIIQQYADCYTDRWWVSYQIWYIDDGGCGPAQAHRRCTKCTTINGSVQNTQRRTTAQRRHSGVFLKHDRTGGTEKNGISGTGVGRRDGKKKRWDRQTFFKAKLWKLTITRTSDPNRPTTCGIIWKLRQTRTPDTIDPKGGQYIATINCSVQRQNDSDDTVGYRPDCWKLVSSLIHNPLHWSVTSLSRWT